MHSVEGPRLVVRCHVKGLVHVVPTPEDAVEKNDVATVAVELSLARCCADRTESISRSSVRKLCAEVS